MITSCNQKCIEAIKYQSNVVNIKAIKAKVGKQADIDLSVGEISVDPKYREANDRLKELDRIQSEICNQIRSMKKGPLKESLHKKYIETLLEILSIALDPESVVNPKSKQSRTVDPIIPELPRSKIELEEDKLSVSKSIIPLVDSLYELKKNEEINGPESNNLRQQLAIRQELGKKYVQMKNVNELLFSSEENTKWNENIRINSEAINKLTEKIKNLER
jgi:hypothetical protein